MHNGFLGSSNLGTCIVSQTAGSENKHRAHRPRYCLYWHGKWGRNHLHQCNLWRSMICRHLISGSDVVDRFLIGASEPGDSDHIFSRAFSKEGRQSRMQGAASGQTLDLDSLSYLKTNRISFDSNRCPFLGYFPIPISSSSMWKAAPRRRSQFLRISGNLRLSTMPG